MKKLMTVLLIAMMGVCFADYKSEFNWGLKDMARIEKGLADAVAAKDINMQQLYLSLKLANGKTPENTPYSELKKLFIDNKVPLLRFVVAIRCIPNLFGYYSNVINDDEILKDGRSNYYCRMSYSTFPLAFSCIDAKKWREKFINLPTLSEISTSNTHAKNLIKLYKKASINFSVDEIKADTTAMKRAWYSNISKSEEWKAILVEVELINKSVQ